MTNLCRNVLNFTRFTYTDKLQNLHSYFFNPARIIHSRLNNSISNAILRHEIASRKIPTTYLHNVQTARSFKTCLRRAEISSFICSTLVSSLVSSDTLKELSSGLKLGKVNHQCTVYGKYRGFEESTYIGFAWLKVITSDWRILSNSFNSSFNWDSFCPEIKTLGNS